MHVRLPQPLISMSIQLNYIQIGRLLRNRRYWFPILFSLSVVLKYKLPVPVYCYCKKFGKIKNAPFSN